MFQEGYLNNLCKYTRVREVDRIEFETENLSMVFGIPFKIVKMVPKCGTEKLLCTLYDTIMYYI